MDRSKSPEIEEYLEALARYQESGRKPKVKDLAKDLGISPASVSGMLKKLSGNGLVRRERYGEISLTHKGRELGKAVLRKHRLIERFLAFIGVDSRKLHKEACVLEHAISDDVEAALGRAISRSGWGKIGPADVKPLCDMADGDKGEVVFVAGGIRACRRLTDMGLTPGVRIIVSRPSTRAGPVGVLVRSSSLAIGRELAKKIFIRVKA
ncbi:MAG: metal-dependent transcriptional regulator [Candidatus Micrarchaeota archaeon]